MPLCSVRGPEDLWYADELSGPLGTETIRVIRTRRTPAAQALAGGRPDIVKRLLAPWRQAVGDGSPSPPPGVARARRPSARKPPRRAFSAAAGARREGRRPRGGSGVPGQPVGIAGGCDSGAALRGEDVPVDRGEHPGGVVGGHRAAVALGAECDEAQFVQRIGVGPGEFESAPERRAGGYLGDGGGDVCGGDRLEPGAWEADCVGVGGPGEDGVDELR